MTTVKQYVIALQGRQSVIALKLGVDITRGTKQARVLNRALLTLLAVLIKTLVDKNVITDAELLAVMDTARDENYPDEPIDISQV